MTHHIRLIAWAMGCIVDDIVIVNVPAAQVSERIRFAMLETWFSEPSAHFVVMIDGEIVTEGEY